MKSSGGHIESRGGSWIINPATAISSDVWESRCELSCHDRRFLNTKTGRGPIRHRQRHDHLRFSGCVGELHWSALEQFPLRSLIENYGSLSPAAAFCSCRLPLVSAPSPGI